MTPEEELNFENELKKLKLKAEFGANFFSDGASKLPAEVESQWLDHIKAFEIAYQNPKTAKIGDLLGNPTFAPEETMSDNDLFAALSMVEEILNERSIVVEAIYEVSEREMYRFITMELMQHEIDVMDIPGMVSHFIYEEFHPNDKEDLKKSTREFIELLPKKEFKFMDGMLSSECFHHGSSMPSKEFIQVISNNLKPIKNLKLIELKDYSIQIDEGKAVVTCQLHFSKKLDKSTNSMHVDQARLDFVHELGYWFINGVTIPSLGFSC